MADWEIKKTEGFCEHCGIEIETGQEFFAALINTEEGLIRQDFCIDGWNEMKPEVFYFWRTKRPDPEEKKKVFVDDGMLMTFFHRLENETDSDKVNFRYVLMLILMRKRLLRYESTEIEETGEVWILKVTGQKKYVKVLNPHLTEDQIGDLTANVGQILQMDFEDE